MLLVWPLQTCTKVSNIFLINLTTFVCHQNKLGWCLGYHNKILIDDSGNRIYKEITLLVCKPSGFPTIQQC